MRLRADPVVDERRATLQAFPPKRARMFAAGATSGRSSPATVLTRHAASGTTSDVNVSPTPRVAPPPQLRLIGASLGDPYDPRTASGAARYLLAALGRRHDLV